MAKKYILLVGVEFNNQGAYLMLRAAAERIREQFGMVPVVEFQNGPDLKKRLAGVYPIVPQRFYGLFTRLTKINALSRVWKRFPWVLPTEIAAVFDGSGFRYGDEWAHQRLDVSAGKLAAWKARGVPVYMLPQAFGPFDKTAEPTLTALRASRQIIARDPESLAHVESIFATGSGTVRLFPDFTAGLAGRFPSQHESHRGGTPIVPNVNIYARAAGPEAKQRYIENLAAIAVDLHERGLKPYGLAHEGRSDLDVLRRVASIVSKTSNIDLEIVEGLNGIELKGLIGTAPLLVSGRYHAVVSALSQGVPTIIHGWSHKYSHVADDFGVPELLCDPLGDASLSTDMIEYILDNAELGERIRIAGAEVRSRVEEMWASIESDLASQRGQR
nr:polysaccharide pyruvyl transferase family protein [Herbiconiux flava]